MSFVDPFLLIVTLVMSCLLIVGNLYFVAKFAHPADSAFGSSTACKAIIVSQESKDGKSNQLFDSLVDLAYHKIILM